MIGKPKKEGSRTELREVLIMLIIVLLCIVLGLMFPNAVLRILSIPA